MRLTKVLRRRERLAPAPPSPIVDGGRQPRAVGDWIDNGDGTWSCWDGEKAVGVLTHTPTAVARSYAKAAGHLTAQIAATYAVPPPQFGRPRLRVWSVRYLSIYGWAYDWEWAVIGPDGKPTDENGRADTQPAALALGLAALDTTTHRAVHNSGKVSSHGA